MFPVLQAISILALVGVATAGAPIGYAGGYAGGYATAVSLLT